MITNRYIRNALLVISGLIYFFASKCLFFDKIYTTSKIVVDEEFHLPLGQAYCRGEFNDWDPKVTTLPGMYLMSFFILRPFNMCNIYYLRFVNLCFSTVNIFLSYTILQFYNPQCYIKNIFSAHNIALLPPLFFFSSVYYTDVLSLTAVLAMVSLSLRGYHYFASLFGLYSVMMRQTNIVWVLYLLARLILTRIYMNWANRRGRRYKQRTFEIPEKNFWKLMRIFWEYKFTLITKFNALFALHVLCYLAVCFSFMYFVYLNGGIVVGDKIAHEVTVHIPQLFYFAFFVIMFSWPLLISEIIPYLRYWSRSVKLYLIQVGVMAVIVLMNSLEHPYLLADNRHYVFYIWRRLYRHLFFRYTAIHAYIFGMYCITKTFWSRHDVSYLFAYIPSVIVALVPQRLIEFRYFFVPYVLYRLNRRTPSYQVLFLELIYFLVINVVTYNVFINREITWAEYTEPQRIIW